MNDSKISVRYSRALFQSALEKKILDKVNQDMIFISEICKIPEAKELLQSPVIVPSKKTAILHKIFEGNVENITLSLIDLVIKNGRERHLPAVARMFLHTLKEYKGVTESILTTAVKVDDKIKIKIVELISDVFKTKVELDEEIDPEIVGGFILRVDDQYIDASVRNKLRKIRKELKGSSLAS
ncbi:MAG TPA: ATP synthase F1 subunit delta [Bacteroidales bacterium]|mgnify:CR=1 FL=1|nr:ATP synthase F1 subunit delta [Bacteroidales bacterium]HPT20914.1 ATP synthase F1 subunit delta [Bacteroidales bacterium]